MEKNEKIYRGRKQMMLENFLGGISWSIGAWIGTTIVIATIAYLLSKMNLVQIIGNFVAEVSKYVAVVNSPFHF